jgi:hypothetical protein
MGRLAAGTVMTAHIAAVLTVDRQLRAHETLDCYEPLVPPA